MNATEQNNPADAMTDCGLRHSGSAAQGRRAETIKLKGIKVR